MASEQEVSADSKNEYYYDGDNDVGIGHTFQIS